MRPRPGGFARAWRDGDPGPHLRRRSGPLLPRRPPVRGRLYELPGQGGPRRTDRTNALAETIAFRYTARRELKGENRMSNVMDHETQTGAAMDAAEKRLALRERPTITTPDLVRAMEFGEIV